MDIRLPAVVTMSMVLAGAGAQLPDERLHGHGTSIPRQSGVRRADGGLVHQGGSHWISRADTPTVLRIGRHGRVVADPRWRRLDRPGDRVRGD